MIFGVFAEVAERTGLFKHLRDFFSSFASKVHQLGFEFFVPLLVITIESVFVARLVAIAVKFLPI